MSAREFRVLLRNSTRFDMVRSRFERAEYSEWVQDAPTVIRPGTIGEWELHSNGVMRGLRGTVEYQIRDQSVISTPGRGGCLGIEFENPFHGPPSCHGVLGSCSGALSPGDASLNFRTANTGPRSSKESYSVLYSTDGWADIIPGLLPLPIPDFHTSRVWAAIEVRAKTMQALTIGQSADATIAGGWGMIALQRGTGIPFRYLGTPGRWEQIGGPAAQFAITRDALFGLAGDRERIWQYSGSGQGWFQVGQSADAMVSGGWGMIALQRGTGVPFRYHGAPGHWEQVGGPAAQFAITNNALFGLAGDRQKIWQYSGSGQGWFQVGESADAIVAGGWGMLALQRGTGVPFLYLGTPGHWQQVGAPAAQFAISDDALFGLAGDRKSIWQYSGNGQEWTRIGDGAHSIVAGNRSLFALGPDKSVITEWALR